MLTNSSTVDISRLDYRDVQGTIGQLLRMAFPILPILPTHMTEQADGRTVAR